MCFPGRFRTEYGEVICAGGGILHGRLLLWLVFPLPVGGKDVIPAVHCAGAARSRSIRLITDAGSRKVEFPISAFSKYGSGVRIGANRFSPRGIRMDLHADPPIGYDIMGPFLWVPGMECRPANQITTQRSSGTWRGGAAEGAARSDF